MLDKEVKKDKHEKLERKLQNRQLSMFEVLQEEVSVDWFKTANPALITMFDVKTMVEAINYIIKIGPADNLVRSYKVPMVATEILSLPMPKVFELFFLEAENLKGGIVLGHLMSYFEGTPNYVISGYVVKIIMNLMLGNAPKVLEFLMKKTNIHNILGFLESQSIAEFLLRIIIVEDILLNNHIKERIELYEKIIDIYSANQQPVEVLENVVFILSESLTRLWTQKHKELGRFSTSIFRIVEIVIDKSNLYQQESLVVILIKHLTSYNDEAPQIILELYKKIYKHFLLHKQTEYVKTQFKQSIPKFTMKNLKLLQALHSIFSSSSDVIAKALSTNNVFSFLFDFVSKYEWNSLVLVEIEKIIKAAVASNNESVYQAICQAYFLDKMKDLFRNQTEGGKTGRGYKGFLTNIMNLLKEETKTKTKFSQYLQKKCPEINIEDLTNRFFAAGKELDIEDGFRVVHDIAKPNYDLSKLPEVYKSFFDETETINQKYQKENPKNLLKSQKEDVLHEIENENQLVYKLLTQAPASSQEEKKIQNESSE